VVRNLHFLYIVTELCVMSIDQWIDGRQAPASARAKAATPELKARTLGNANGHGNGNARLSHSKGSNNGNGGSNAQRHSVTRTSKVSCYVLRLQTTAAALQLLLDRAAVQWLFGSSCFSEL
jgi:hypothetical protein